MVCRIRRELHELREDRTWKKVIDGRTRVKWVDRANKQHVPYAGAAAAAGL